MLLAPAFLFLKNKKGRVQMPKKNTSDQHDSEFEFEIEKTPKLDEDAVDTKVSDSDNTVTSEELEEILAEHRKDESKENAPTDTISIVESESLSENNSENISDDNYQNQNSDNNMEVSKGANFVISRLPATYTEGDNAKWVRMHQFRTTGKPIKVIVATIAEIADIVVAECYYEDYPFKIMVPFANMDTNISKELSRKEQGIVLKRLVGASIFVVIETMNDGICVGNRKHANYLLRRKYFYTGVRNLTGNRKTLQAGDTISDALIVGIYSQFIRVEIAGQTCRVPLYALSKSYINPNEEYSVGDTIALKITKCELIKDDNCGVIIGAKASNYDDNYYKTIKALDDLKPQVPIVGTVKRYNADTVLIRLVNGANAVALAVGENTRIRIGSQVVFMPTNINKTYAVGHIWRVTKL